MASGKKSQLSKAFVWLILILIMIGLVGFGATGLSGTARSIGHVGDTAIDINRYAREMNNEMRAFQAQTGQSLTFAQAQAVGLDRAVLQRLISTAALEDEASNIGISVGDEEVGRQVLATPAFQGINGQFDRDAYEFTLEQAGLTPARFEETVRADVARTLLQAAVSNGVNVPTTYADTLIGFVAERRNFSWLELDRAALETPLSEPSDEDLRAYYDAHSEDFTLPEAKKITYAWLSPDFVIDQVEVDEQTLRRLYDDRFDEFNTPERRLVERLVFGTAEEAATALASVVAGDTNFGDLVTARGLTLTDIDLGDVTKASLGAAGDAVFALDGPGIAGPVETDLGPALFRVNAILSSQSTSFEDALPELRDAYAADAARRDIADRITNIDDLLAGGATLEELASETDMQLAQIEWTPELDEGIAAYAGFAEAAGNVTLDDFPEVLELDDGGIFALRLDDIIPARPEPIDDAVIRVIDGWEREEISKRLTQQAEVIKAQLENGARMGSFGLPATVETHITRDAFIEGTVPSFIETAFTLEPGDVEVVDNDGSVLILQMADVLPANEDDPDVVAGRIQLQQSATQAMSQDVLDAFTRAIESNAGIQLNQNVISAVNAQFQ